jgi:hypothetical protein
MACFPWLCFGFRDPLVTLALLAHVITLFPRFCANFASLNSFLLNGNFRLYF